MHNTLAVLLSIFFFSSWSWARALPPPPVHHTLSASELANKCSFTLWHKQLVSASLDAPQTRTNYIQINTLIDHANDINMDIAHLRPAGAFHSYSAVSSSKIFAIDGLLDGRNLTVKGNDNSDVIKFESDGLAWVADEEGRSGNGEAWCDVEKWDADIEDGKADLRERRMECVFPCEKIEEDNEEERMELR